MLQYAALALGAVNAISAIRQGYAEKEESEYNAGLINYKVGAIEVQKNIEYAQYERLKARTWGTSMANAASMGIRPTGSALAVMNTAQKNIMIDQVISKFNREQEKKYTVEEGRTEIRRGKKAVKAGYTRGLTSILSGAVDYYDRTR